MQVCTQVISSGSSARYATPSGRVPLTYECTCLTCSMSAVAAAVLPKVVVSTYPSVALARWNGSCR
jgi:hypothetical protein